MAFELGFDGKRALVIGGATGIGAAAASLLRDLGAHVTIADVATPSIEMDECFGVDLRDRASVEALVDGLRGPVDVLLSCAGVADGTPNLPLINFIGHRLIIERAVERNLLPDGAAIGMIASIVGMGWAEQLDEIVEFLDTDGYDEAAAWIDKHPECADYAFSKRAMIVYCARRAAALSHRRIRFNCIAPGPTMTPLMARTEAWQFFEQAFANVTGRPGATTEQQARALVFLVSEAADYVSGACLPVDGGFITGGMVGSLEHPIFDILLG
jgi:NAD(P)-dependent dehydrogenase (short-subunit alcohol dehydrogenase family)